MLVKLCILFVPKSLIPQAAQKLGVYHFLTTQFSEVFKIWQWMLRRRFKSERSRGLL